MKSYNKEYTREEMREACRNNYNAGRSIEMVNDYTNKSEPTSSDLKRISSLGQLFVGCDKKVKQLEYELEIAKKAFEQISTVELPDAMNSVDMKEFRLTNGYKIRIEEVYNVRLPKERVDMADTWLDEHGHGGMIKRSLQIELPKTLERAEIEWLKQKIKELEFDSQEVKNVHWATLQSWANEMREGGEAIPEDIFAIYRGNKTVISE